MEKKMGKWGEEAEEAWLGMLKAETKTKSKGPRDPDVCSGNAEHVICSNMVGGQQAHSGNLRLNTLSCKTVLREDH